MSNILPPILISAYIRPEKLGECLESISQCKNLFDRAVYVTSDAAGSVSDEKLVKKCRDVVEQYSELNIQHRYTTINSKGQIIQDAAHEIMREYPYFIALEDDNVVSEDFLIYMDYHLSSNLDNQQIFSVCGYSFPVKNQNVPIIPLLWQAHNAWGAGYFTDRFLRMRELTIDSHIYLENYLSSCYKVFRRQRISPHFLRSSLSCYVKNKSHDDVLISIYMYLNSLYSIYPSRSLVRNTGHDGSGVNNKKIIEKYLIDQFPRFDTSLLSQPQFCKRRNKELRRFFSQKPIQHFLVIVLYIVIYPYIVLKNLIRRFNRSFRRH